MVLRGNVMYSSSEIHVLDSNKHSNSSATQQDSNDHIPNFATAAILIKVTQGSKGAHTCQHQGQHLEHVLQGPTAPQAE